MTESLTRNFAAGQSMTKGSACDACRTNHAKVLQRAGAGLRRILVRSSVCNPRHFDGPAASAATKHRAPSGGPVDGMEKNMPTPQRRKRVTS